MSPFLEYLKEDRLPNDPKEARKIEESAYIIWEVYEGVCDTHIGARTFASKIARTDYYWPTLK
ncbi:hypothetical protein CR513_39850, partial [Mucuna pruriens]